MPWSATAEQHEYTEALEWFLRRSPMRRDQVDRLPEVLRRRVLWFTGIESAQSILWVRGQLEQAISEGWPIERWRKHMAGVFAFAHEGDYARARTVLRTNVFTAVNDARYTEQRRSERLRYRPFLIFDAVLDTRTTEICRDRDRKITPVEDPYVLAHTPPLHYQCRSVWRPLTERQALQRGGVTVDDTNDSPVPDGFGVAPSAGDEVFAWPEAFDADAALKSAVEAKIEARRAALREALQAEVEREVPRVPGLDRRATDAVEAARRWFWDRDVGERREVFRTYLDRVGDGWAESVEDHPSLAILDALLERIELGGDVSAVAGILSGAAAQGEVLGLARALGFQGSVYGWTSAETADRVSRVVRACYGATQALLERIPVESIPSDRGAHRLILWGFLPLPGRSGRLALETATAGREHLQDVSAALAVYTGRAKADQLARRGAVLLERAQQERVFVHPWVGHSGERAVVLGTGSPLAYPLQGVWPSSGARKAQVGRVLSDLARGLEDDAWLYGKAAGYIEAPALEPALELFKLKGSLVSSRWVQEIATGKRPTSTGTRITPIDVLVDILDDGRVLIRLRSGRERIRAARLAGATKILADIRVHYQARGTWILESTGEAVITIPTGHGDSLSDEELESLRRGLRGGKG